MPIDARGPAKRDAMLDAARIVFGRDGYVRGSIEAIASEASVSTRTIYNHFQDKQALFLTMILDSAERVRDAQLADIERHIGKIGRLEEDLRALGRSFAEVVFTFDSHFAVVRQIHAEAPHLPSSVLAAWQAQGPQPVHDALARELARLSQEGRLTITDAPRAAQHFIALVSFEVFTMSFWGAVSVAPGLVGEVVADGVKAFLGIYGPRAKPSKAAPRRR